MSATITQLEPRMNIKEISEFTKLSPRTIENCMEEGLPSAKVRGRRLFKASEVADWIDKEGKR